MYELTEGDTRDVHFAQTLPNEPIPEGRAYFETGRVKKRGA